MVQNQTFTVVMIYGDAGILYFAIRQTSRGQRSSFKLQVSRLWSLWGCRGLAVTISITVSVLSSACRVSAT